ncbi:MAG: OmpA family protein [Deltaproteobacteria bacterium]|nr:OmpA family protein [Deltaproteobacteria bacterium]
MIRANKNRTSVLTWALGAFLPVLYLFIAVPGAWGAAPSGTVISNTAKASYPGMPPVDSNMVDVKILPPPTKAVIEFLRYAPSYPDAQPVNVATTGCSQSGSTSGPFTGMPSPQPLLASSPLNLAVAVSLVKTTRYHANDTAFVRLTDGDQNLDATAIDTVTVTLTVPGSNESETLRLQETGLDTGVFAGYITIGSAQAAANNCVLNYLADGQKILASYADPVNGDTAEDVSLVDPYGLMFDSATGAPVNGAIITLIDNATGLPAVVAGDDGVSAYPSTVTTGGAATDGSGKVYNFPAGEYRFPFIAPGNYRFDIIPALGYRLPSTAAFADLQSLPGAPFVLDNPGSIGGVFNVPLGVAVKIDIPTDPVRVMLYLTKTASKSTAAVGDFLQYRVGVENTSTQFDVSNAVISDEMPLGFRYRKGSATLGGVRAPDPLISSDGRTLSFAAGSLAMNGGKAEITYVAAIAAGAKTGKAVNTAYAVGTTLNNGTVNSNTARATVEVKDDLFAEKSFIAGRVAKGCDKEKEAVIEGEMEGIRIYLEDGTYTLTDKKGMYHFAGVKPGSHVVQMDKDTIPGEYEVEQCEDHSRFAGSDFSQFVDLQGGALWRADFYLAEKPKAPLPEPIEIKGQAGIELSSALESGGAEKDGKNTVAALSVDYSVFLQAGNVPLKNLRVTVLLPDGVDYVKGSSTLGDAALLDPLALEGSLTYRLFDVPADWQNLLKFAAAVPIEAAGNDLAAKAMLTFDTSASKNLRTPLAENILQGFNRKKPNGNIEEFTLYPQFDVMSDVLSADDKEMMGQIIQELKKRSIKQIVIEGHTDSNRVSRKTLHIFPDNYALSRGRAQSVANFVKEALNLKPEQLVIAGYGPDKPVAANKTSEGRALNRRVEMKIAANTEAEERAFKNDKDRSGLKTVEVTDVWRPKAPETAAEIAAKEARAAREKKIMPLFDVAWTDAARPGFEWLWPFDGFYPPVPSLKVAIKHDPAKKLQLFMNGVEVDPVSFDNTVKSHDDKIAVSIWRGIGLVDGDNLFEAAEYDNGVESGRIKRVVHYSRPPVKAELVMELSRLVADGKNPPVAAIRLTDKDGHPAREGIIGEYAVDLPFMAMKKIEDMQDDPLSASKNDKLRYEVGGNGMAYIKLRPTTQTGEAAIRLNLMIGEQEVKAWMQPDDRDWILVGMAEGTAGYNAVKGNMESLGDSDGKIGLYEEGRTAFFAKGKIKGKWLLTAAYDSDKSWKSGDNTSLHQTIAPDKYYTIYGDGSYEQREAASARPLYVKIERDRFYALFGDYNTGLTVTNLSRYSRNFNGLKSELKGDKYDYNVFVSDNNQQFVKDEIRGDGTSGLYRLSRKSIVLNSESIVIETRDRFRSEVIVSSKAMSRFMDYSIDYDDGAIHFKSPVGSRDENFNPNYIVVNYETYDAAAVSYNYGGRGAARVLDKKVEIGGTYVKEDSGLRTGSLAGVDATVDLGPKTKLKAETAATNYDNDAAHREGTGYLAELSHKADKMDGKAYVREQGQGFGLGQERSGEAGTRKYGVDAAYRPIANVSLTGGAYRQYKLYTLEQKDMAEMRARYTAKGYELYTGLRHAEDTDVNGGVFTSEQVIAGAKYNLLRDRLALSAQREQSVLDKNASVEYPSRTSLGADYKLNDSATLIVRQEFVQGADGRASLTQAGLNASPWTGGQLNSTVGQQLNENGARVFSSMGLKQAWKINAKWSVDGGVDNSATIKRPNHALIMSAADSDFTAVSLGAAYRLKKWAWTGRAEARHSAADDKTGLFTGMNGELRDGIGVSAGLQGFNTDYSSGDRRRSGDLRLGAAYRPAKTRWIILDRLDFLIDEQKNSAFHFSNRRIVNNLNVNFKIYSDTQLSLQYGAKYVKERIDSFDYSGYTDLLGGELRHDVTRRLDVGLRSSVMHSWKDGQCKLSTGPSIGYNVVKNVWLSVGYNVTGFRDRDFSKADFTAAGPYIKFRVKFDKESARDAIKWFTGQ